MPGLEGQETPGGDALDTTGAADGAALDTGGDERDSPYEKGSVEDTALTTLREIQKRGEELGDDDAPEGETEEQKTAREAHNKGKVLDPKTGKYIDKPADPNAAAAQPKPHDVLPRTWKRELGAEWGKLPEGVRQEIYRREQDALNGISTYKRDAETFQAVAQDLIVPYMEDFEAAGVTPKQGLKEVVGTWSQLVRGDEATRVGILLRLADDLGINRAAFGAPRDGGQQHRGQGDDPRLTTALQRIAQLEGNIRSQDEQRSRAEQDREHQEIQKLATEFNRFRADPKNEHVDKVAPTMQRLIMAGEAESYQEAYDKACQLDPSVREALATAQAAQQGKDEAARVAAAKRAGGTNVQRRGTPAAAGEPSSMAATARSVFRSINARNGG